jgi:5-enolpyruvylshikimate-3-phosphate synthase
VVEAGQIAGDTPRRLKRLARSYLLLRASLPNEEARQLEVTEDASRAIAFLLAAASGAPRKWPALCRAIDQAKDEQSLAELLSNIGFDIDEKSTHPSISICRNWINEVGRFAFVPVQMGGIPIAVTLN